MFETDTLPSEVTICSPRRSTQIRYHYFHYYGLGHPWLSTGAGWVPPVDVYETDEEFVVEVNLAGIDPKRAQVHVRGNAVVLTGERPEHDTGSVRRYHVIEIERGTFSRVIELPLMVDPASARAESNHGMLVVRLNKMKGGHVHGCYSADSMEGFE
jgi:HSP20 family protein